MIGVVEIYLVEPFGLGGFFATPPNNFCHRRMSTARMLQKIALLLPRALTGRWRDWYANKAEPLSTITIHTLSWFHDNKQSLIVQIDNAKSVNLIVSFGFFFSIFGECQTTFRFGHGTSYSKRNVKKEPVSLKACANVNVFYASFPKKVAVLKNKAYIPFKKKNK